LDQLEEDETDEKTTSD